MNILNHQIFAKIKTRHSLIALAIKASTQRRDWQKDDFKMFRNLLHSVFNAIQKIISQMDRKEALRLVLGYLEKRNLEMEDTVLSYSNKLKKRLVRSFNFLKYRKRWSFLSGIEISEFIQPDIEVKDQWMVSPRGIYQTQHYWLIPWGPKKFIEEWDIREALIGAGPIVIDKQTSRLFFTNSSMLDVLDQIKNGKEVDLSILANRGKEIGEESKK